MCHVSCVTCHMSYVTCHLSPVTCQNIFLQYFFHFWSDLSFIWDLKDGTDAPTDWQKLRLIDSTGQKAGWGETRRLQRRLKRCEMTPVMLSHHIPGTMERTPGHHCLCVMCHVSCVVYHVSCVCLVMFCFVLCAMCSVQFATVYHLCVHHKLRNWWLGSNIHLD